MPEVEPIRFSSSIDPSLLTPADTTLCQDRNELHAFEGLLVESHLPPSYDDSLDRWANRPYLANLILPKRFFGTLADIKIQLLEEPYDKLAEHFPNSRRKDVELARLNTIGFILDAVLVSTSVKARGSIDAQVWISRRTSGLDMYGEYNRRVALNKDKAAAIEKSIRAAGKTLTATSTAVAGTGKKTRSYTTLRSEHTDQ
jgi:hypothetical protein